MVIKLLLDTRVVITVVVPVITLDDINDCIELGIAVELLVGVLINVVLNKIDVNVSDVEVYCGTELTEVE